MNKSKEEKKREKKRNIESVGAELANERRLLL